MLQPPMRSWPPNDGVEHAFAQLQFRELRLHSLRDLATHAIAAVGRHIGEHPRRVLDATAFGKLGNRHDAGLESKDVGKWCNLHLGLASCLSAQIQNRMQFTQQRLDIRFPARWQTGNRMRCRAQHGEFVFKALARKFGNAVAQVRQAATKMAKPEQGGHGVGRLGNARFDHGSFHVDFCQLGLFHGELTFGGRSGMGQAQDGGSARVQGGSKILEGG